MGAHSEEAEERRTSLILELEGMGAFRRGSVTRGIFRKCGKAHCRCAKEGDPGHGPSIMLTRKEGKKTLTKSLAPGDEELVLDQIKRHDRFRDWCARWLQLNEEMSDGELVALRSGREIEDGRKKKSLVPSRKKSDARSRS